MKIFSNKTKSEGGTVIMGRKTFLSLPEKFRPLSQRTNIILTRNVNWNYEGVEIFNDKESLLTATQNREVESLWICGGAEVYRQFIDLAEELHISEFEVEPKLATAFFPVIDNNTWKEVESETYLEYGDSPQFTHKIYKRKGNTSMN
jgi:dihydrofolate reductase